MSILRRIYDIARAEIGDHLGWSAKSKARQKRPPLEESFAGAGGGGYQESSTPPPSHAEPTKLEQAYAALEIPYDSDLSTARKAWRTLLRQYHPDLHSTDDEKQKIAHEVSQQLNDALDIIKNHKGGK